MNIVKRKFIIVAVSLMVIAVAFLATTQNAYLAPLFVQGESESFRYSAQGTHDGGLYITVSPYFDDANAMQKYRQVSDDRGNALFKQKQKKIPVVITLTKPMSQAEARILVKEANVQVDSFLLVGHSNLNKKRGTYIQFGDLENEVAMEQDMDPSGKNEKLILTGVMVIKGVVKDSEGLARLIRDKRTYLVDTSEFQVRELLQQRHSSFISGKTLYINVPSPYWDLEW